MMYCVFILLLLGIGQAFTPGGDNHQCEIELHANWNATPFSLQLIETVSSFNESAYQPLLELLFGVEKEDEQHVLENFTDVQLYDVLMNFLEGDEQKRLVDIYLANKFITPRIETHFNHYRSDVLPKLEARLLKQCGEMETAFALLDSDIYCDPQDLFAIRAPESNQADQLLPFDRVIGKSESPIITLYGDFQDHKLHEFFHTLYQFSQNGQYRFIWRYTPIAEVSSKEILSGYGVDLTLKRTDYIAIDDRNKRKFHISDENSEPVQGLNALDYYFDDIQKVFDIESLELQFTKFILDQKLDGYFYLKALLSDFPKHASFISTYNISQTDSDKIVSHAEFNKLQPGIYVNGRFVEENALTVNGIVTILKQEFEFVDTLAGFNVNASSAKNLIQSFASLQENLSRDAFAVRRYNILNEIDCVIYFNDLEKDSQYQHFKKSRKPYLNLDIKPGQLPSIAENIHDSIFVIQLSDPMLLIQFLQLTSTVLYHQIPQQVGIVPLVKNDVDLKLTKHFLYLVHSENLRAGFLFLQELGSTIVQLEDDKIAYDKSLLSIIPDWKSDEATVHKLLSVNKKFIKKFNIRKQQIIVNGVFYNFVDNWQMLLTRQLYHDVIKIRDALISGDDKSQTIGSLRELLFEDSFNRRNTVVISDSPDFEGVVSYLTVNPEQFDEKTEIIIKSSESCTETPLTMTLVGRLSSQKFWRLLVNAMKEIQHCAKVRIIDIGCEKWNYQLMKEIILENPFPDVIDALQNFSQIEGENLLEIETCESGLAVLEELKIPELMINDIAIILNGKLLVLDQSYIELEDLELLMEHERQSKLDYIYSIFKEQLSEHGESDDFRSFEKFSSLFLHHFYSPDSDKHSVFSEAVSLRLCTSCLDSFSSVNYKPYNVESKVDVMVIIKPIEEYSQKVVALLELLEGFKTSSLNIKVLLQPSPVLSEMNIKRFYRGVYPSSISFTEEEKLVQKRSALFESVPEKTLFTFDIDAPSPWVVGIVEGETDLDNVRLMDTGDVHGVYELENILVEGFLRGVGNIEVGGIQVQLSQGDFITDTNVMVNLGYLQLKANPGIWELEVKSSSSSEDKYELLSADETFSEVIPSKNRKKEISVMDLSGKVVFPVFNTKPRPNMLIQTVTNIFQTYFSKEKDDSVSAEINIFSVASGHLYERFLGIMTESVLKHTTHSVKFWFIENYMSPTFKRNLPKLAAKYGFKYELITYNWPIWLRPQREKQRTIWGYKILFLDVLFPQSLDKVIFVDADQIVRTDMKELVDIDLQGAPYGYTPMCDSRSEMDGFRFWKQGYWDKVLGQNGLKYHISALYVIDLKKFREMKAGDILRQHYQALSADPGSLSNLDQDLPNNLQNKIKIFSLPQEWLWCETWCSDESLKTAKTIDLCNNPLTKEPKLDRARRQISEWTEYDDEINELLTETKATPEKNLRDEL